MKILDAIRETARERIAVNGRVTATSSVEPVYSMGVEHHCRVKNTLTVAIETTGPEEALSEMHRRARKAVAYEIFGEIESDLRELQILLWEEEQYRGVNDPVLLKIGTILSKFRDEI